MCGACSFRFTGTHEAALNGAAAPPSRSVSVFVSSVTASIVRSPPAEEGRRSDVLHEHQDHTQENEDEGEENTRPTPKICEPDP